MDAQVQITQQFSEQAGTALTNYATAQRTDLQKQLKEATTAEDKDKIQSQINQLNTEERVMNVLIGVVTGQATVAAAQGVLSEAADLMRQETIRNSKLFPGVTDGDTTLSNMSGKSEGVQGDGFKGGGTRTDLDSICGTDNRRCVTNPDGSLALNDFRQPQLKLTANGGTTLENYYDSKAGKDASGPTGGIQGAQGTLFGKAYDPGSWVDKLIEAFSGPHDFIGGEITGLYDEQGNIRRGMSSTEQTAYNVWSGAAIPVAAPFATATALPPQVWNAIADLLRMVK